MGVVYNVVSQYVPFLRKRPVLTREQALSARPIRNPALKWRREDDNGISVFVPRRKDLLARFLARVFRAPGEKEITLDEVGADIWELCDGSHSVEAIVSITSRKYRVTRRECEMSVSAYLKMLGERNLVGFQVGGRRRK